jgi:hypothetical protein
MSFNSVYIGKVLYSVLNATVPVYPMRANQATALPYCTYDILSNDTDTWKDGTAPVDTVTVLLNIYAATYSEVNTLANSVRVAFDGQKGTLGGIAVNSVVFVTESDDIDDDAKAYVKTQEYRVRLNNTSTSIAPGLSVEVIEGVSVNGIIGTVTAGYELNEVIALQVPLNTPPSAFATLNYGTTSGASNISSSVQVANTGASTKTTVNMVPSHTGTTNVYASSGDWNGGNFTFILIKSKTS